jgi:hypothetical protein
MPSHCWQLFHYQQERSTPVHFTRGRPDHANDNAHVEQKNWCVVRQYLGYDRFDNPAVVPMLNALYRGPVSAPVELFYPFDEVNREAAFRRKDQVQR